MFVETVCMYGCLILYSCGHGSDWNIGFQLFEWVCEYFWQYSVYLVIPYWLCNCLRDILVDVVFALQGLLEKN